MTGLLLSFFFTLGFVMFLTFISHFYQPSDCAWLKHIINPVDRSLLITCFLFCFFFMTISYFPPACLPAFGHGSVLWGCDVRRGPDPCSANIVFCYFCCVSRSSIVELIVREAVNKMMLCKLQLFSGKSTWHSPQRSRKFTCIVKKRPLYATVANSLRHMATAYSSPNYAVT